MCMVWPCYCFVDDSSYKCINVNEKKKEEVKLINNDCLPILMLLYIMLYVMLAYLMLLAALSNAVCSHSAFLLLIFANALSFHALSWFIGKHFVYFMYDFASCTALLICWFFLILCSHHFSNERAMCSLEK